MLIPLDTLMKNHDLKVTGVLHVGAHLAEELPDYRKHRFTNVFWVEANPVTFRDLEKKLYKYSDHTAINAAVADQAGIEVAFNIANNGQSSSLLEFGTHSKEHPEVIFTDKITVTTTTIRKLSEQYDFSKCNFWNLDIQGAELLALHGGEALLNNVDYIFTEVNVKKLYKGCCLMSDIDEYLTDFEFERFDTVMTRHGWGDAFYKKVK